MDTTQEYWKNIRNIEDSYLEATFSTWDYPLRKNTKEKILHLVKNSDLKGKKIHLLEIGCGTGPNIWKRIKTIFDFSFRVFPLDL